MRPEEANKIYFLGIGGIGMSALARYFRFLGKEVAGYDRSESRLTQKLIREGIPVHFVDDPGVVPAGVDLAVYTPAIPESNEIMTWIRTKGIPLRKRSEILGMITKRIPTIAVAGTHGKTTVTAMISHLLSASGKRCLAFLGGVSKNIDSNVLLAEDPEFVIAEADEYDRSFLKLFPDIAVVTSVEADHFDIYRNMKNLEDAFRRFAAKPGNKGNALVRADLLEIFQKPGTPGPLTYSAGPEADFHVKNLRLTDGKRYLFDLVHPGGVVRDLVPGTPGYFNLENSVAAVSVALLAGIDGSFIRRSLETFRGLERRLDFQIESEKVVYIDDYAHHPTEIDALVDAVRTIYPEKRIAGVFQPHLYSRTRDHAVAFAESLENLDVIILLDIYPAREDPIPGVSAEIIFNKIRSDNKVLCSKSDLIGMLDSLDFDILLTIGAGDIDRLVPEIRDHLIRKEKNYEKNS